MATIAITDPVLLPVLVSGAKVKVPELITPTTPVLWSIVPEMTVLSTVTTTVRYPVVAVARYKLLRT